VPGIERLELTSGDTYQLAISIKHAPLIGTYHGHVTITEQQYPYHYRLAIQGEGPQNTFSGNGSISLNKRDKHTIVAYRGSLTIGKPSTLLPPSVVKGTAKLLIQQFFTSLALHMSGLSQITSHEETTNTSIVKQSHGNVIVLPPPPAIGNISGSIAHAIVRRLRLGTGNPTEEARWETRVQRVGMISGLLLLVWLGTRLPKRK